MSMQKQPYRWMLPRKDIPVADVLSHVTPMDPEDNVQLPIIAVNMITTRILMSVESQGSFSNKL